MGHLTEKSDSIYDEAVTKSKVIPNLWMYGPVVLLPPKKIYEWNPAVNVEVDK